MSELESYYYYEDRAEIAERKKKWEENNKEKVKASKQKWNAKNPDYQKQYREKNAERLREYDRARAGRMKAIYAQKVAQGFRVRKDPTTGKVGWVFVGIPTSENAA